LSKPWRHAGKIDITPPILNLGTRRRWVISFTPRLLFHRERTLVSIELEACWATEPVWTFWRSEKSLARVGTWTLHRPAHSLVTVPTNGFFNIVYVFRIIVAIFSIHCPSIPFCDAGSRIPFFIPTLSLSLSPPHPLFPSSKHLFDHLLFLERACTVLFRFYIAKNGILWADFPNSMMPVFVFVTLTMVSRNPCWLGVIYCFLYA
jgi:hypothetical protein